MIFMKKLKTWFFSLFIIIILTISATSTGVLSKNIMKSIETCKGSINNFYFVHITDTHVMDEKFDNGFSKMRLRSVLENVTSFEEKPAFVVITGDLVEWGSSGSGALNYQTFLDCFYEKENQLYADKGCSIPVYTTPGNHDYFWENNLDNYHAYVDKNHVADEDRYTIVYGDVSLFFMDSGANYLKEPYTWFHPYGDGLFDDDIAWLEEQLSTCKTTHKIVLMHHPAVNVRDDSGVMYDVIARNRMRLISLCEEYDVDLVLTGHTHCSRVFDADENLLESYPFDCSEYSTLFVQTDDCKEGVHYRNITVVDDDICLEKCEEIKIKHPHDKSAVFIRGSTSIYKDIYLYILYWVINYSLNKTIQP